MKVLITLIALTLGSSAMAHRTSIDHNGISEADRADLVNIIKSGAKGKY